MTTIKKLMPLLLVAAALGAYLSADESTRRYLKHLARQVPHLPYRYFI